MAEGQAAPSCCRQQLAKTKRPITCDGRDGHGGSSAEIGVAMTATSIIPPVPRLFNFNNPLGACPTCEGFGDVVDVDMDLVVPDNQNRLPKERSRSGTHRRTNTKNLSCWRWHPSTTCQWMFRIKSCRRSIAMIIEGVPERKFGGLKGFFDWLDRKKYKMHVRILRRVSFVSPLQSL